MEHKWKIGDWCEFDNSVRRWMVFAVLDQSRVSIVNIDGGATTHIQSSKLRYIAGCDSWDWQPPIEPSDPGEGYRFIDIKTDIPKRGDEFWSTLEQRWIERVPCIPFDGVRNDSRTLYRRKTEPQYRQFANAGEFKSHRDRWWKKKGETILRKTEFYSEKQHGFATWEERFANYEFEDGTPFGILDDAKPSGSGSK
jgi:hypothetical protein